MRVACGVRDEGCHQQPPAALATSDLSSTQRGCHCSPSSIAEKLEMTVAATAIQRLAGSGASHFCTGGAGPGMHRQHSRCSVQGVHQRVCQAVLRRGCRAGHAWSATAGAACGARTSVLSMGSSEASPPSRTQGCSRALAAVMRSRGLRVSRPCAAAPSLLSSCRREPQAPEPSQTCQI